MQCLLYTLVVFLHHSHCCVPCSTKSVTGRGTVDALDMAFDESALEATFEGWITSEWLNAQHLLCIEVLSLVDPII